MKRAERSSGPIRRRRLATFSNSISSVRRASRCRHLLRTKLRRRRIRPRSQLGPRQERGRRPLGPPLLPQSTGDGHYAGDKAGKKKIMVSCFLFANYPPRQTHMQFILLNNPVRRPIRTPNLFICHIDVLTNSNIGMNKVMLF